MNKILEYLQSHTQDAILAQATDLFNAATDSHEKQDALNTVAQTLGYLEHELVRDDYVRNIAKQTKIPVKTFKTAISKEIEANIADKTKDNSAFKLPKGVDAEAYAQTGYYPLLNGQKTGYYFKTSTDGNAVRISNFIMTPLFHKPGEDDNTRISRIDNGRGNPETIEMQSASVISMDMFRKELINKGIHPHQFGSGFILSDRFPSTANPGKIQPMNSKNCKNNQCKSNIIEKPQFF